jgi:lysophospholipase L1-like esterase
MRPILINTLVVLVTLLFLAAAGEVTVRVLQHYDYLPYYGKSQKQQKTAVSKNDKYARIKFVKSDNPKLFIEIDPTDPQVNKFGMRGPAPALSKAENVYRIAVLGDSVAFGYGLPDAESFPRQLERLLNQHRTKSDSSPARTFEIINFAVSGYGLEAYTEVYRTKVRPFKPDLVILAYILNDPYSTKVMFDVVNAAFAQRIKLQRIGEVSQLASWLLDTGGKAFNNYTTTNMFEEMYFTPEYQHVIDDNLALLNNDVKSEAVPLVAFIFPYFHDMSHYPLEKAHAVVGASLRQAGIPYHDLLDEYRLHDGLALRLEPSDYTHPNAEGQRIAAEAMENYLKLQKIL